MKKLLSMVLPMAALVALATLSTTAKAQTTYSDNASNYTGTYAGANKGTGFGAFNVTAVNGAGGAAPYSGVFLGSAASSEGNTGTPAPSTIDTSGTSFGFYANQGTTASVSIARGFSNSLTKTNDSFSLDFVGGYNDNGTVGVNLTNAGGSVAVFQYSGTTGNYSFNGAATGINFTPGALHLTYTFLSSTSVRFSTSGAFSYTGTATLSSPITGFNVFQTNTNTSSGNADHNGYFNNLSYTIAPSAAAPEPADVSLVLAGASVLGSLLIRRRARR